MSELKTVTFDASQWQIVPKTITKAMIENVAAFGKSDGIDGYNLQRGAEFANSWKDALAAAPTPAAQDKGHCMCPACRDGVIHASDCAVHNAPALPTGTCDCGAAPAAQSAGQEAVAWQVKWPNDNYEVFVDEDEALNAATIHRAVPIPLYRNAAPVNVSEQSAGQEAVGVAGTMPGTEGFTMVCFEAAKFPVGTRLYAAPVNGGERPKSAPLFMTGWQLLEALDLVAPDRDTDRDQLDCEIALQMGDATGHSGAGLYAWEASEPEEGSSFLAGERTVGKPSDCSGEPECCPQNEGYGCHCGTRNSDVQRGADASPTDYAALEREHFGDPDKRTGIYAERAADAHQVGGDMLEALESVLRDEGFNDDTIGEADKAAICRVILEQAALSSPPKVGGDEREAFKREERYIVIKRKNLSGTKEKILRDLLHDNRIPTVECVVVESDWPEYGSVWAMIEARMTGRAALSADGGDRKDAGDKNAN
ncbi:hypothetical protein [Pandoraea anhela]|uniref:Uncharacterized protein n=1 Tax=Pandoraea anhela TaxID=2508295 RepID=A0A5E4YE51_9BURK|nr:hypothetical protein [Pandoraea anhela]VVE47111.1 hypothetical protein PAN31108_04475 [Pandoraea anhela]